jgi:hypothetical protein
MLEASAPGPLIPFENSVCLKKKILGATLLLIWRYTLFVQNWPIQQSLRNI